MNSALIAKLESASEGSRELDLTIATRLERKLWLRGSGHNTVERNGRQVVIPHYTASIDAALALAERVIKVRGPIDLTIMGSAQVVIHNADPCGNPLAETYGHTPALAICAALLRASAAEGAGHE
jgi:hypothetical protein